MTDTVGTQVPDALDTSWFTGDLIVEDTQRYRCSWCRTRHVAPGRATICQQCLDDLNTPALPAEEIGHCPQDAEEQGCQRCFEDPEVQRLSRTGGWQDHCHFWRSKYRLDGTFDPEGIFEDSIAGLSPEERQSARFQRRCTNRLGVSARALTAEVYDLLVRGDGEPRMLTEQQKAALQRLRSEGPWTRVAVLEALVGHSSQRRAG